MQQGQFPAAALVPPGTLKATTTKGTPRVTHQQGFTQKTGNPNIDANNNRAWNTQARARRGKNATQGQVTGGYRFEPAQMTAVAGPNGGVHYRGNFNTSSKDLSVITEQYGTAIDLLMSAWQANPACRTSIDDQRRDALLLLQQMIPSQLNGTDIQAVLNTIARSAEGKQRGIIIPSKSQVRWAKGGLQENVAPRTYKTPGRTNKSARASNPLPSYFWFLVRNNCQPGQMAFLANAFAQVLAGQYGMQFPNGQVPNYSNYPLSETQRNLHLAEFWAAAVQNNPACQGIDVGWIARLLDDVKTAGDINVNFRDLWREFTVQAGGPIFDYSKFRVGSGTLGSGRKGTIGQRTGNWDLSQFTQPGVRSKAPPSEISTSNRVDKMKVSLLWYLAQNYCPVIPLAVSHIESIFGIQPPPGVTYTNISTAYAQQLAAYKGSQPPPMPAPQNPGQLPTYFGAQTSPGGTAQAAATQRAVSGAPLPTQPQATAQPQQQQPNPVQYTQQPNPPQYTQQPNPPQYAQQPNPPQYTQQPNPVQYTQQPNPAFTAYNPAATNIPFAQPRANVGGLGAAFQR